jgi:hypothetical protein
MSHTKYIVVRLGKTAMIERLLLAAVVTLSLCWFLQLGEYSIKPSFLGKKLSQTPSLPSFVFNGFW